MSQISVRFALQSTICELQSIFKNLHRITPKVTLNYIIIRSNVSHICVTICSVPSPIFQSASLYDQPFQSYRPFWDRCTECPQYDVEEYKVKYTLHVLLVSMSPKFNSVSLYDQPFSKYKLPKIINAPNALGLTLKMSRANVPCVN